MILANAHVVTKHLHLVEKAYYPSWNDLASQHWIAAQREEWVGEHFDEWQQLEQTYRTEGHTVSPDCSAKVDLINFLFPQDFPDQDIPF